MPITTGIIRVFSALILSIPLFFIFSYYLLTVVVVDTLLNEEFVAKSFQEVQLYDRAYQAIFLRQEFSEWTDSLVGGFQVSDQTKAQILKEVIPPTYLKTETERNVSAILGYVNGHGELNVFLDLNVPLENLDPAAFAFLDQQLAGLNPMPMSDPVLLSDEIASFLTAVAVGQIPSQVPVAEFLTAAQQAESYRQALDVLAQSQAVSSGAIAYLKQQEPEIIAAIQGGDLRAALVVAGHGVAEPRIDEAVARIRGSGDAQMRVDLIEQLAEHSQRTRSQVLKDAGTLRFLVQALSSEIAQWSALVLTVLLALAVAAVFIPYWKHVIYWPSVMFFLFGLLLLLAAASATLDLSLWSSTVCKGPNNELCQLMVDTGRIFVGNIAARFVDTSLSIMLVSAGGILVGFIVSKVSERKAR